MLLHSSTDRKIKGKNMNRELLETAGIDVADGLHRFMNSEQMYVKYLNKFVENDQFAALKQEVEKDVIDCNEAFERAHALKGICANLSMAGMLDALNPIVEALRGGSDEGVREGMPELQRRYEQVISAIQSL